MASESSTSAAAADPAGGSTEFYAPTPAPPQPRSVTIQDPGQARPVRPDEELATAPAVAGKSEKPGPKHATVWGMSLPLFIGLMLGLGLLLFVAAIAGGIGGGLAHRHAQEKAASVLSLQFSIYLHPLHI
jgi:hypothetical protein